MKARKDPAKTLSTTGRFVDTGIDSVFVHAASQNGEGLSGPGYQPNESVPHMPVQPVGQSRQEPNEGNNGLRVKIVDPHSFFEKAEQGRLGFFQWIGLGARPAIHDSGRGDSAACQNERYKDRGRNKLAA